MRWFRKQDEVPRLLSLSPLRTTESNNEQLDNNRTSPDNNETTIKTPKPNVRHRSRIGKKNVENSIK